MDESLEVILEENVRTGLLNLPFEEDDKKEAETKRIEILYKMLESERKNSNERIELKDIIDYSLKVFSIVVPLVFYGAMFRKGLRFEEEGVVSSTFFRNFLSKKL